MHQKASFIIIILVHCSYTKPPPSRADADITIVPIATIRPVVNVSVEKTFQHEESSVIGKNDATHHAKKKEIDVTEEEKIVDSKKVDDLKPSGEGNVALEKDANAAAAANTGRKVAEKPIKIHEENIKGVHTSVQQQEDVEHSSKKSNKLILSKDVKCAQDVAKHCSKVKKDNNFAVFICLQEVIQREEDLDEACEQHLWNYKYNLTIDPRFDEAAIRVCGEAIDEVKDCHHAHAVGKDGFFMNCLVEHRNDIKDEKCHTFLTKMAVVIFNDYRLIHGFYEKCNVDVKLLKCGQLISGSDDENQHEQEGVISCLEGKIDEVRKECKDQITHVAELQADDYHLDRPLFYACQDARDRFCHDVKSGEGRVYKCLLQHINEEMFGEECSRKLHERQNLMQENKKTNYALWHSCQPDFEKYKCAEKGLSEHGEASNLLLCLQEKVAEGLSVSSNCRAEMRDVAVQIFNNYKISPIIVANCDHEINTQCKSYIGTSDNGGMMDCLMTMAATNDTLSKQCFEAVTTVLKETGAGNNYKVDHALYVACEPAISNLCNGKDDAMIMGCLMDNVHNPKMPEACSTQVFHLQYFLSRDFRLDATLYQNCEADAVKICHASSFTEASENNFPQPHNFVIACLYRNSVMRTKSDGNDLYGNVSPICSENIKRVMHQRASNIKLMPEIEIPCLTDLGKYCIDKATREGEEVECLQENYEQLSQDCKAGIGDFTELEARDFDLDKHLVDKCGPMVTKFCKRELEDGGGEQVLPCLIKYKNDIEMDHLCADAIEHWQLLEMKDFKFSPLLKDFCLNDIRTNCHDSKSKTEAIRCLSQVIVSNFGKVSESCRTQLKKELIEQTENIKLMPELYSACQLDIRKFCANVPASGAQLEECLRNNHKKLQSKKCRSMLFEEEKVEAVDPDLDYRLMHVCEPMIKIYCMHYSQPNEIVECLRQNTHDRDMSIECRKVIKERQIEQAESYNLDTELSSYCKNDALKYCKSDVQRASERGVDDDSGEVFACLVDALMKKQKIAPDCENFIRRREAEAAIELDLNPQILQHCSAEMDRVCPKSTHEEMVDCLKSNIPNIKSKACVAEVRKLIVEGIEDVHVDPHLEEKCSRDIRTYCQGMPKKSGNVVLCLIDVHKATNLHLQAECDNFLTKRLSLYNAAKVNPATFDSITNVLQAVSASPNRNSIYITVMLILGVLFLGGILFGRVTKQSHAEMKNR